MIEVTAPDTYDVVLCRKETEVTDPGNWFSHDSGIETLNEAVRIAQSYAKTHHWLVERVTRTTVRHSLQS